MGFTDIVQHGHRRAGLAVAGLALPGLLMAATASPVAATARASTAARVAAATTQAGKPVPAKPHGLRHHALPRPMLTLTGISVRGSFIEADLSVSNHAAYPDFLFAPAPGLPPCGLNTHASRTWVDIYDGQTSQYIYGFCGLTRAQDLTSLWFARPVTTGLPHSVHIRLVDRMTDAWSQSNTVNIP